MLAHSPRLQTLQEAHFLISTQRAKPFLPGQTDSLASRHFPPARMHSSNHLIQALIPYFILGAEKALDSTAWQTLDFLLQMVSQNALFNLVI